jgi:hypothetical protein
MNAGWSYLSPGDLVRYITDSSKPHHKFPNSENPIGIVISVDDVLVGPGPDQQSIMEIAEVVWSDTSWGTSSHISFECPADLFVIQKGISNKTNEEE